MKITIIGGGIAGLSTALALKQKGYDYEVYEAATEIKEVGAGLWCAPNAMEILHRLGIGEQIENAGLEYSSVWMEDCKGNKLQKHDVLKTKEKYGHGIVAFERSELQKVLYQNIDKSKIFTNKKCIGLAQEESKTIVKFDDGTTVTSDLVIGADGIHSVVRNYVVGEVPFRYSGQTCWRCILDNEQLSDEDYSLSEIWGKEKGQRIGYGPLLNNKTYYYLTYHSKQQKHDNKSTLIDNLLKLFTEFPEKAVKLIRNSDPNKIIRNDLYDFKPLNNWVKNTVVILGDAAHSTTPNLGQGACQAIESAWVLAECLSNNSSVEEALKVFQEMRIKRATYITNTSWQIGQAANMSGLVGNFIKFKMLKYYPEFLMQKQFDRVYSMNY